MNETKKFSNCFSYIFCFIYNEKIINNNVNNKKCEV